MNVLQNIIFKDLKSSYTDKLFLGWENNSAYFDYKEHNIRIFKHRYIASNTFYNAFDLSFWKRNCGIKTLFLTLRGRGKAIARIGLGTRQFNKIWLEEAELDFDCEKGGEKRIEVSDVDSLEDGVLSFDLIALSEEFVFEGGFYGTDDAQQNDVKMGIVVTHFNHQKEVASFYARLNAEILSTPEFSGKIKMVIVDNSNNLDHSNFPNATIVPNNNLGGSGGFTRGLMYLQDNGFTNCVFMDDDGDLLLESIARTEKIFEYVKDKQTAIAGVLLQEEHPNIIREMGATFNKKGFVELNYAGIDLDNALNVVRISKPNPFVNYGAWCYFGFNVSAAKILPFPFFVRGDDIYFSLQNKFNIVSEIGIACLVPSFELKESPLTRYLGVRSELLITLSKNSISARKTVLKNLWHRFFGQLYSYNYASCLAITRAISDINAGAKTFFSDPDAGKARSYISSLPYSEKKTTTCFKSEDFLEKDYDRKPKFYKLTKHKFVRHLTINGLLLPKACTLRTTFILPKSNEANKRDIYRHDTVYYYDDRNETGYFAHRQTKAGAHAIIGFVREFMKFKHNYRKLCAEYRNVSAPEDFWKKQFGFEEK